MKRNLTAGCLFCLGLPVLAIEAPGTSAPIPPQLPGAEARHGADNVAPPAPRVRGTLADPDSSDDNTVPGNPVPLGRSDNAATPAAASAYLGVGGAEVPDILAEHLKLSAGEGLVIRTLDPDGPAAKAGLSENDVITHIDGKNAGSQNDLREIVSGHKPGEEISIDYIHKGDVKTLQVTLAAGRPSTTVARGATPLDRLRLGGMPDDQARQIQQALERNLRAFEDADRDQAMDMDSLDQMQRGLQERMQRMLGSARSLNLGGAVNPGRSGGNGMSFKSTSSVKLLDDKGSIELSSEDDSKSVRAYDHDGKLQWEGPYNNEDDKKAMPEDVRNRVDKLSPDMDFKGNGFRLKLGPRR